MKFPGAFIKNTNHINVIIETPRYSNSKYSFDKESQLFKLTKILPQGLAFPLHFGFIPDTTGEDGDPLDVLVLMDEPSYPGCLIECKIIGTIEADQTEEKKKVRNDRIIAAALEANRYEDLNSLNKLDKYMLKEIVNFFKNYNEMAGKEFEVSGICGPQKTISLIKKALNENNKRGVEDDCAAKSS